MAIPSPSGYSAAPAETSNSVVPSPPLGGTVSLKEAGGLNSTNILFNLMWSHWLPTDSPDKKNVVPDVPLVLSPFNLVLIFKFFYKKKHLLNINTNTFDSSHYHITWDIQALLFLIQYNTILIIAKTFLKPVNILTIILCIAFTIQ